MLPFFREELPRIAQVLENEKRVILPPKDQIFTALRLTPLEKTLVVILGQDPYPTPGHAHGLAFSVEPDVRPLPRSLGNIFKEMQTDLGGIPATGDLRHWARQGVLMINTALTVPAGEADGHKKLGWSKLTHEILTEVSKKPTAFVLWGKTAQSLGKHIQPGDHLKIETAHPSPLSARRGFFDSRPFSRINAWLIERGESPINWITDQEAP
nr:uracil-DNA glycosylase [Cochlodiniinecator piscidefendens]